MYVNCNLCKKRFLKYNFRNHWVNCYRYHSIIYLNKLKYNKKSINIRKKKENTYIHYYKKYLKKRKNNFYNSEQYNNKNNEKKKYNKRNIIIKKKIKPKDISKDLQIVKYNNSIINRFNYNNTMNENMFSKMLHNSSVVIVGPSSTIKNSKQGKLIDSHDIIIRLNRAIPIIENLKADIGSKTTIIYTNLNYDEGTKKHINFKKFKKNNIKFLCSPYPPIKPFKKDLDRYLTEKHQLPFHHLPIEDYVKTKSVLGCRPYTGMSAIIDILRNNIKSLYITGIDFYANDYYSEYRNKNTYNLSYIRNNRIHNSRSHLNFIKYISLTNPKVKIDKALQKIVYKKYRYCLDKLYKKLVNNTFNSNINFDINDNEKICIIFNSKTITKKPNIKFDYKILIYPSNNIVYDYYDLIINLNRKKQPSGIKYKKLINLNNFKKNH